MNQISDRRYLIDPYLDWVKSEGVPVTEGFGVDLFTAAVDYWPRFGVRGGAIHCRGRGDFTSMFLLEIPGGKSTSPQRHLFEEVVYILEGSGSTQLEFRNGQKRSFEWGPSSLFAIPLNARYRHFNGRGSERALMVSTTNAPLVMNTFINPHFVFESEFDFIERSGKADYYAGDGQMSLLQTGTHLWETNFVPDIQAIELKSKEARGASSLNLHFMLADGLMHAHVSEMPSGTYKKGHRHASGYHVMGLQGEGFSLMWFDDDEDFLRIDWKHGMVFPPADKQFHQHFNTAGTAARYLATGVGSNRFPFTTDIRAAMSPAGQIGKASGATSIKDGGDQIEYEDQDPRIHRMWLDALARNNVSQKMGKYIKA